MSELLYNPTIGAASTHYHLYYWSSGKQPYEDPFHYPGGISILNKLNEINEQLSKHPYMINLELSLVEDFESEPYWVLCLVLSDNRSLLGNRIQIELIDIRQLSTKSPNVGMCSVYQLCDVKDRQMEHIRYWFEDIEERMISCYCNSFEVTSLN